MTWLCQCRFRALITRSLLGALELDAAQDHGQLGCRHTHLGCLRTRKGEGAAFQAPQIQGETVPLPGQDLQPVAATILEDKQIARQWIAVALCRDHGREPVKALAAIDRLDAHPDAAAAAQSQHVAALKAATRVATAAASAPAGTRTTNPVGSTTSRPRPDSTRKGTNRGR